MSGYQYVSLLTKIPQLGVATMYEISLNDSMSQDP